ncbi:acyl-[ACP]--phospholipid O-acyltransferase [Aliarcobacter butzleri]|uniref:acyl-[ACP]--phospholipid O-acyltransferase n=1 Tax=Aliarcobacter butzleri TaxID=28197 RepID=UPI001260D510|nr:acyl-[ACP]--phospholipid O-acyltransferase [Aliarcobacter butzleri]MDN5094435.1 acyl-[ACP]--phospholipid O-acyltransferase [Aliarcobacter butzleri]MDN5094604.1 acyl-[ACP]--phospholipid O-acyltransferase [Aliarcobacter butzleri]MDN5124960.1 acyl-[ACP]--phospholipid O-acyltransferase [Aliarcobacter butzleri]
MKKIDNLLVIKIAFLFVVFCNAVVDVSHKVLLQNIAFKIFDGTTQVIWVSIINVLLIIPFLLLFTFSGYLSDKYNKKDILVYGALSSFLLSSLMIAAYISGNFYFAMFALFLLAIQSAIYGPAKLGLILDIYGKKNLSRGNAALQAISIIAILFAIGVTSFIFEKFYNLNNLQNITSKDELLLAILPLTYYILPVAFLEMVVSFLFLRRVNTNYVRNETISLNKQEFFKGRLLINNIKNIYSQNVIFLSVIGLSVFYGVSQGVIAVFPSFAKMYLNIHDVFVINGVIAASGIGIAIGSIIYSRVSKFYIEVGTIPFASFGMATMIYISTIVETPFMLTLTFLVFGIFGGMFVVPLNSLIQFNAKKKFLGTILAGNNWFQSLFMFLMLCITTIVSFYDLDPLNTIYLILSIIVIGTLYTVYKLPQSLLLLFLKAFVGLKYKLEVDGIKNIPSQGGVLLLGNHVSWIDWAIILMAVPREVKFVMDKTIYNKWYLTWLLKMFKCIPISNESSKSSMQIIAKELDDGNIVVLFPEGAITRNGHLGEFKRGFEKILEFTTNEEIKVIPFYIRGLWESMFSRANKRFKDSNKTNRVTVSFARMMNKNDANAISIKNEVFELSAKSWKEHINHLKPLNEVIFDRLKEVSNEIIFADSTNTQLSGNRFLTASILFKNLLKKDLKEQNIGLLLPSSVAGAFMNYMVLLMGKIAINLNYTSQVEALKSAIIQSQTKSVITSKKFVEKLKLKGFKIDEVLENVNVFYMEDLKTKISKKQGIITLICVKLLPSFILKWLFLTKTKKDNTAMILFSSGSEGSPKGIELSGDNILGNAQQIANIINVNNKDVILGSLPLFHAFGIVVNTYLPLIEGIKCVAHPDPTDGLEIAKLIFKHKVTFMCGTSTFFRLYVRNQKIHPLMFESLRLVVAGAEKLREDVKIDFKKRFGKDILEGFGTTETSPVATCNLPNVMAPDFTVQIGQKAGTVGMAIPGTTIKIVDPMSFEELKPNEEGMIVISGIQVMKGYLGNEEKTKEVLKTIKGKTYYITGDKGKVDEDGFLTIIDRYSRFAKLGGEMVSLTSVEDKISKILELKEDSSVDFIATNVEDEKKGEKIVLLISNVDEDFVANLKEKILNNFDNKLMIPSEIKIVKDIPKLGSGKKDFNASKLLAKG